MTLDYKNVRRPWSRPPYPFYHHGPYLEEAAYLYFLEHRKQFKEIEYTLIPIFWTTAYLDGVDVQPYLDALPPNKKYYAVSQHDDAIKERLPTGTVVFSAGGNSGGIPIPLVSSKMPEAFQRWRTDQHLASFVGSITHSVRQSMIDIHGNDPDFVFETRPWDFSVASEMQHRFLDMMGKSKFALCPRGYGAQSFRAYEALQLGAVPVYIHDDNLWLPFHDKVPWEKFAVLVHEKDLPGLKNILESVTDERYAEMKRIGQQVLKFQFNIDSTIELIHNHLIDKHYNEDN